MEDYSGMWTPTLYDGKIVLTDSEGLRYDSNTNTLVTPRLKGEILEFSHTVDANVKGVIHLYKFRVEGEIIKSKKNQDMKQFFAHINAGSRGNSPVGQNFGRLENVPPTGWRLGQYAGSLLAWNIYHSPALSLEEAKAVKNQYGSSSVVLTEAPCNTHEKGMILHGLLKLRGRSHWRYQYNEAVGFYIGNLD